MSFHNSTTSTGTSASIPLQNGVKSGAAPSKSAADSLTVLEEHNRIRNSSENLSFVDNKVPSREEDFAHFCQCTLRHYSLDQDARNLHDDVKITPQDSKEKLVTGNCKLCGGKVVKEVVKKS